MGIGKRMGRTETVDQGAARPRVWVWLVAGGTAWLIHFLAIYGISEWRCVPPVSEATHLGLSATAWLLLAFSVLLLAVSCAATVLSYRDAGSARPDANADDADVPGAHVARVGMYLNVAFALIILVETIPIFFFRTAC